jgi:hypothetical protein
MKKHLIIIPFAVVLLASCDKIENPVLPTYGFDLALFPGEIQDYPYPDIQAADNPQKNVLLEDYTGHRCPNCPVASGIAEQVEEDNYPRVVTVSIHASTTGNFQLVDDEHPTDFTTEAGDSYIVELEALDFNPIGNVNRKEGLLGGSGIWLFHPNWESNVEQELETDLIVDLQVHINHYPETNGLFVHSRVDFQEELEGRFHIVHYLVRKEVESPQTSGSNLIEDYIHHNVLSGTLNGAWGEEVLNGTASAGSTYQYDISYELPGQAEDQTFASENLKVISYIMDRDTYEIFQVVSTDIL